jgi:hypothetical protein
MQRMLRFRIPALFCAFAVFACELISHPVANMGVDDDGPYILMVQHLVTTGHVAYNGWAAPMLTWQLYLAAALVKLFGFSFTTVRASTILVAAISAFFLHRILVRSNITERNATLATLALVLSPLYLMLSATFMTDIHGLFAVILCLYACLRALQASTSRSTIAWICFAIAANCLCGSSRQIAWLGTLVMVPSTLWLLRANRRVFLAGLAANFAGALFIVACLHWLKHQPYIVPVPLIPKSFPLGHTLAEFIHTFLDIPFFLLPIFAVFLPQIRDIRQTRPRVVAILSAVAIGYIVLAVVRSHLHPNALLEPIEADYVSPTGLFPLYLQGPPPIFLHTPVRILLTIASIGGLLGLIACFTRSAKSLPPTSIATGISWKQLNLLLTPFAAANILLLVPNATEWLTDRYLLVLLTVVLIVLTRTYQEQVQPRLPATCLLLVAIMAVYAVAVTHNLFALARARVALAAEIRAAGIPDTSIDNGWEYNFNVELQHAPSLNVRAIIVPAHFYVPSPPPAAGTCSAYYADQTPHIHPLFGVSFVPDTCAGPAPFAPIHYTRWLAAQPGTLYVVRYTASERP